MSDTPERKIKIRISARNARDNPNILRDIKEIIGREINQERACKDYSMLEVDTDRIFFEEERAIADEQLETRAKEDVAKLLDELARAREEVKHEGKSGISEEGDDEVSEPKAKEHLSDMIRTYLHHGWCVTARAIMSMMTPKK